MNVARTVATSGVLLALVALASVPSAAGAPWEGGLIVFASYDWGSSSRSDGYDDIEAAAKRLNHGRLAVVVNVDDGPGSSSWSYRSKLRAFCAEILDEGQYCLGYVDTRDGARSDSSIRADIDKWEAVYGRSVLNGIFFDHGVARGSYFDRYSAWVGYAESKLGGAMINAGNGASHTPIREFAALTFPALIVYDDDGDKLDNDEIPAWVGPEEPFSEHVGILVHDEAKWRRARTIAQANGIGWLGVSDRYSGGEPTRIAEYWGDLIDDAVWGNK